MRRYENMGANEIETLYQVPLEMLVKGIDDDRSEPSEGRIPR